MRRRLVPAALSIAALSAVAFTVPSAVYAAPAAHGRAAKTVTVKVADPRGDVVAKSGSLSDMTDGDSLDGFKPGHGTVVTATAADRAVDLTKVSYRVQRTGHRPALVITYVVAGPFTQSDVKSKTATTYSEKVSGDVIETSLGKGFAVGAANDSPKDAGLMNARGKTVACKGLRTTMKAGTRVATQTVPLSCLNAHGLRASRLRSATVHVAMDVSASLASAPMRKALRDATTSVTSSVTMAIDYAAKPRRLQLTPLAK